MPKRTPPVTGDLIAILGYGVEGRSTLQHLLDWGHRNIVVLDKAPPAEPLPPGVRGVFGPDYLRGLAKAKIAVRSPGFRPFVPEVQAFLDQGGALTSQIELVFASAGKQRIVGVTGTLGKGTCCSLLSAMLERAGIPHQLAGNIGLPALDAAKTLTPEEFLILELSSFQLATLKESPGAAVVLRTTTEHLDWHASRQEYWEHKANLVRHQKAEDFCVYFADAEGSAWIGTLGEGRKIPVGKQGALRITASEILWPEKNLHLKLSETRLVGAFNLENLAAAAATALELGASPEHIREAARDFIPLEHRLEFVREFKGARYYNDSYATRPEASLAAARALRGSPLGLVLGGSEKFADFSELAEGLAGETDLKAVALIGQTAERLEAELRKAGALEKRAWKRCDSLDEALEFLRAEIPAGSILLSPACASFGLFANYKERGHAFKRWVNALS